MHLGDPLAKICKVKLGENLLCPRVIPTLIMQATNVQLTYQVLASMTHAAAFEETSHVPRPSASTLSSGERPGFNEACEGKPNDPHYCYV